MPNRAMPLSPWCSLGLGLCTLLLAACTSVPFDYPKGESFHGAALQDGNLELLSDIWLADAPQATAVYPLTSGSDAFDVRLDLIDMAQSTIDAQYFLIKPDRAGEKFTGALLRAADRGVRVRVLLDDIFTTADDEGLAALNAHENIQVRLFNPLSRQGSGTLNYIADFKRANRRMHNKSFTVDGRITVIGGRNIAGEYFGMNPAVDFRDFELVAFGGLIPEVGDSFDDFWNHDLSVPMEAFAKNVDHNDLALMRSLQDDWREANPDAMADPTTGDGIIARLMAGEAVPYYAEAHVISDHPDKLVNPVTPEFQKLANSLGSLIEGAQEKVVVYSPYFIPQRETTDMLLELRRQGREIYILTNSLASTNHVAVHAGYRRYRQELLDGGVIIFEVSAYGGGDGEVKSTLHTKAVIVDSRWLFVGSLNVDPRSIDINTEMGLVLDAPEFVADLWAVIEKSVGQFAYEVEKGPDGKLQWRRTLPGKKEEIVTREPESTGWQRFKVGFYGMLPIESQL